MPTIDNIKLGEDYKDLKADIKILTNRTDVVDSVYKGYAEEFMKMYPNIKVTYDAVTDYEESLTLRLTSGDWGDICFIPSTVDKSELGNYFTPLGDYETLNEIYNFVTEKTYDDTVYGIPNGGTAGGVAYNKKVWADAGITELPKTPDEFLADLKLIREKQMPFLCIQTFPQAGLWEHGMIMWELLLTEIRITKTTNCFMQRIHSQRMKKTAALMPFTIPYMRR